MSVGRRTAEDERGREAPTPKKGGVLNSVRSLLVLRPVQFRGLFGWVWFSCFDWGQSRRSILFFMLQFLKFGCLGSSSLHPPITAAFYFLVTLGLPSRIRSNVVQ